MRRIPWRLALLLTACMALAESWDDDLLLLQKELRLAQAMPNPPRWTCEDRCVPAVWVVSPGRSGSTTVLEMLNALPGFAIMGENQAMWGTLYELAKKRAGALEEYRDRGDSMAWRQSDDLNWSEILCSYQLRVLAEMNPPNDARVVGFKEIRWAWSEQLHDLELLMEVFPCSFAVLNYRKDIEAEAESRTEATGYFPPTNLAEATKAMLSFYENHRQRSFLLPLENFSTDLFNQLLRFLGEDQCSFTDVLHDNSHSGYTRGNWRHAPDVVNCTS
ncbi:unnamed protein product [Symbiodinium sp. CCMP2456]|nr:unnamed protein product [Symbiodinium sp. CCMP2456]